MTWIDRWSGRARTRTLKSFVLRVVVPRLAVFGAGAAILGLGRAMAVSPSAHSSSMPPGQAAEATPAWTAADGGAFPGCRTSAEWPTGTPAAYVVVHSFRQDQHLRLAFDEAWRLNHNDSEADDVWVLGVCGRP